MSDMAVHSAALGRLYAAAKLRFGSYEGKRNGSFALPDNFDRKYREAKEDADALLFALTRINQAEV